jgi:nitrogen fixation NifU-like protein
MMSETTTESRIQEAIANPKNLGEMADADAVGTVGSPECGDMVRMWLKFSEKDGRKVIDRASFQSFGCQTAIAVASVATELLAGKTIDEALALQADELSKPLGPLPPMKIHCGQMVEGALRQALEADNEAPAPAADDLAQPSSVGGTTLLSQFAGQSDGPKGGKLKIVKLNASDS